MPRKAKPKKKTITHHAKRIYQLTPKFVHGMVVGCFVGVIVVLVMGSVAPAAAVSLQSPRDCDTNAVINCGALNTTELKQRYNNAGVAAIYKHFSISAADIKEIGDTAVAGRVYKNGKVTINGTVVATQALTAGRKNITGSKKVTAGGVTFYTRAPSVSFRVDSIAAYVVMKDGQFRFAILAACGNPVNGVSVPKKTPPPTETPPQETPPPELPPEETPPEVPVVSTQTPPSTPTPQVASSVTTLPNTGPGAVVLIAIISVVSGYIFHATHRHIRRRRAIRHAHRV